MGYQYGATVNTHVIRQLRHENAELRQLNESLVERLERTESLLREAEEKGAVTAAQLRALTWRPMSARERRLQGFKNRAALTAALQGTKA